jgi:hypothetical protein
MERNANYALVGAAALALFCPSSGHLAQMGT